jgi:2-polyprenyl-6-methoxyphenol hydroxylase-like FAD-dependent oxidoreductase
MNVIIVGGGKTGVYVANLLLANHCRVKVMESRRSVLNKVKEETSGRLHLMKAPEQIQICWKQLASIHVMYWSVQPVRMKQIWLRPRSASLNSMSHVSLPESTILTMHGCSMPAWG